MKVVINDCYGGFSLSYEGVMEYAKLKGMKLYAFTHDPKNVLKSIPYDKKMNSFPYYSTTDVLIDGKIPNDFYFSDREIDRSSPELVEVVRKLKKKANGNCASLKIVTIPDDVKWHIQEYDGYEHVAEDHRTWH